MPQRRGGIAALAVAVALPLAGCGGEPDESPTDLLARAKTTLDDASSVYFTLDTAEEPAATTGLLGGDGHLVRPASFHGTLQVLVAGATVEVEVVSVDGTVYAQLPFTSGFTVVDPADFGIGDPAALLDPEAGISQFLEAVENPQLGEERRVGGEVVREVTGTIPGDLVEQLLTSQDPDQPVDATFAITTESAELRRAELTGPFFTAEDDATYVVELSDYGADVEISAPPTG
jgi:LppX_LprAFG lipoprotein